MSSGRARCCYRYCRVGALKARRAASHSAKGPRSSAPALLLPFVRPGVCVHPRHPLSVSRAAGGSPSSRRTQAKSSGRASTAPDPESGSRAQAASSLPPKLAPRIACSCVTQLLTHGELWGRECVTSIPMDQI